MSDPVAGSQTRSSAEMQMYDLLRRELESPPYCVLASTEYIGKRKGGDLCEGELDLLVFHPEQGILVIEVKGGGVSYNGNTRRWYSVDRNGVCHGIKNPFKQAQKAVRAIKARLARLEELPAPLPFPVGYAVAFPNVAWRDARLPMDAERGLIIDSTGLTEIARILPGIMAQHRSGRHRALTRKEAAAVRTKILYPMCHVIPSVKSTIDEEELALNVMTEGQKELIAWLEDTRQIAIKGYAGTGKTVIAVEKARRLAAQGLRVAFLCFNAPLAEDIRSTFESYNENVDVSTYHALCRRVCKEVGIPFDVPQTGAHAAQRFWDETAHRKLEEALERTDLRYDAIVVDEGQDFRKDWWLSILGLLKDQKEGYFYIFFDPKQSIYCDEIDLPVDVLPLVLNTNCRNTRRICTFLCDLSKVNILPKSGMPEGKSPRLIEYTTDDDQIARIEACVKGLIEEGGLFPSDIVCLSTHSRKNSCLRDVEGLAGRPLAEATMPQDGAIRFSSLHRFKGLEANVVLLCDVTADSDGAKPEHLYVAASRAKHRVYIFHDRSWKMPTYAAS